MGLQSCCYIRSSTQLLDLNFTICRQVWSGNKTLLIINGHSHLGAYILLVNVCYIYQLVMYPEFGPLTLYMSSLIGFHLTLVNRRFILKCSPTLIGGISFTHHLLIVTWVTI